MPARKYTRMGEHSQGYECCNKKCKWQGTQEQKGHRKEPNGWTTHICPNCAKDEFYGLLKLNQDKKTAPC